MHSNFRKYYLGKFKYWIRLADIDRYATLNSSGPVQQCRQKIYLLDHLVPTVEVPADLVDQSVEGFSVSVAGETIALSSRLTWDLLPTPGKQGKLIQH